MGGIKLEDRVAVGPLREAVEGSGMSWSEVALKCGRARRGSGGDSTWLKRKVGVAPEPDGSLKKYASYGVAVAIVKALDLDPVDYGV